MSAALLNFIDQDIGTRRFLTAFKDELTGGQLLNWRAYRHDNGYLKIELASSDCSGAKVRLNIWHPNLASMENLHNHKWDYVSQIIVGRIREELYVPCASGLRYEKYTYQSRLNKDRYDLEHQGTACLRQYAEYTWDLGQAYHRTRGLIHRIQRPADKMAASLQVTFKPRGQQQSDVYSRERLADRVTSVLAPALSPEKVGEEIEIVLKAISL